MPPENFRQDLGFNPFDCETISDVDQSLDFKNDEEMDDDSLYQMDRDEHKKPGFGDRRKIDPDDSINISGYGKTGKGKKFLEIEDKKQDERVGQRMEQLYGPEDTKIKSILSKKVAEKMIKTKIKTEIFKKSLKQKKERKEPIE